MPINKTFPKALYNLQANINGDFINIVIDYYENYNEFSDSQDGKIQINRFFPKSLINMKLATNTQTGYNDYAEVSYNNDTISISQGEYVWVGGDGQLVDPSYLFSIVLSALGIV